MTKHDEIHLKKLSVILIISCVTCISSELQNEVEEESCSLFPYEHFLLYSKCVLTPKGVIAAIVEVKNGKFVSIVESSTIPKTSEEVRMLDYGKAVIMPGLVDIHVHLNEPGREEWEGFVTGTNSAAAGGVTTLIDMPLNSFPTTTSKEAFELKLLAAKGKLAVDVGFWGGLVPENAEDPTALKELLDAGALGLKAFMCPSGINDFPMTTESHLKAALPVLAKYGRPLLVHAEVQQHSEDSDSQMEEFSSLSSEENWKYLKYLASRPSSWEKKAVQELVEVSKMTLPGASAEGAHIHIVHLSDASDTLDLIKMAKHDGASLSVETCPHYLAFSAEEIPDGSTQYKCAPPIRHDENRGSLWKALMVGHIDLLSSDHSPAPPHLKLLDSGDFMNAWGGISSLQLVLPATWTYGREYDISLENLSQWWSTAPAKLAKLSQKGSIEVGKDADLVIWDPETSFMVDENYNLFHKHKVTPYSGKTLYGQVISTFSRGNLIYSEGHHATKACGLPILST